MWKTVLGIVVGFVLGMTMLAGATFQAKYETDNSDVGHVVMYGIQTNGTLQAILVNASGAIKTY